MIFKIGDRVIVKDSIMNRNELGEQYLNKTGTIYNIVGDTYINVYWDAEYYHSHLTMGVFLIERFDLIKRKDVHLKCRKK